MSERQQADVPGMTAAERDALEAWYARLCVAFRREKCRDWYDTEALESALSSAEKLLGREQPWAST